MGNSAELLTAVDIGLCTKLKGIKASEFLNLAKTKKKVLFVYLSKLDLQQSSAPDCLKLPSQTWMFPSQTDLNEIV